MNNEQQLNSAHGEFNESLCYPDSRTHAKDRRELETREQGERTHPRGEAEEASTAAAIETSHLRTALKYSH